MKCNCWNVEKDIGDDEETISQKRLSREKKSSEVILGEKGHDEICNGVIYLRVVMSFCNGSR